MTPLSLLLVDADMKYKCKSGAELSFFYFFLGGRQIQLLLIRGRGQTDGEQDDANFEECFIKITS